MTLSTISELEARVGTHEFDVDPIDTLTELRQHDPVHWSDNIGGWLVTRFDDVITTFKKTDPFSNEGRLSKATAYLPAETRIEFKPFEDHYNSRGLLHVDPPDHTRLRGLVVSAFNPRVVESMRPRIQAIVDELLDRVAPNGGMEVIEDLAWALPSTVLAELLGAPEEARELFKHWVDDILAFQGVNKPTIEVLRCSQDALVAARAYLKDMIEYRRQHPGTDLISHLATAEIDGEKLTEPELLNIGITLMTAGQETTTALVGNSLYLLLSRPELWAALRQDHGLVASAIEEVLRYESPIPRQPRVMKRDAELRGKQLRKGDVVFQMLNAANRDPEHFVEPDTFDIRRRPNRHLGFGLGAHFCVGAPLSRAEGQIVLDTILRRFPNIRLVDQAPDWNTKKRNSRVLKTLHVAF